MAHKVKISHKRIAACEDSGNFLKKSFNNLSIDNPERDLMEMHYGHKREPVHLYRLEVSKVRDRSLVTNSELKSGPSIDQELYSNQDLNNDHSTSSYLPQDQSPRVSLVQFTEPLIKGQENVTTEVEEVYKLYNNRKKDTKADKKVLKSLEPHRSSLRQPNVRGLSNQKNNLAVNNQIAFDSIQSTMSSNMVPRENLKKNLLLFIE